MKSPAYLIVICNEETNQIEEVSIWSSPEWEQSRCIVGKNVYVAYKVNSETFQSAKDALIKEISKDDSRYNYLYDYLEGDSFPALSEGTKLFFPFISNNVGKIEEDTIKLVEVSQEEANRYVYTLESGQVIYHCKKDELPFGWFLNKKQAEDKLREKYHKQINKLKALLESLESLESS
jgi:hypothetical protein